jgi:hypothetical protein
LNSGTRATATFAACVVLAGSLAGCADGAGSDESRTSGLTASGVTLEVPAGRQTLTARGRRLELRDGGAELLLSGDTRIEIDGPSRLEASADRLRVLTEGPVVELTGGVRATIHAPGNGEADGGS